VVAETISLYLQMESLERRIQIALENIGNFRRSLALVESRYKRGLTSVLDVRQARRILAGTEALLRTLREELGATQQRLSVVLGRSPKAQPPRPRPEDYFRCLAPVPPLLERGHCASGPSFADQRKSQTPPRPRLLEGCQRRFSLLLSHFLLLSHLIFSS